jgi:CRISPR-associated protein Cmr6
VGARIINLADKRGHGDHPGLIHQRYLTRQLDAGERCALLEATAQAARSESLRVMYAEAFARWTASFPKDNAHLSRQFATTSRLVVGLGAENVLETGLRLHHTYGVPIIPGSALKGLASHYGHDVWGQRHLEEVPEENQLFQRGGAHHSLLFGTTEDGGVITFHDSLILPAALDDALRLDVMTPHHPKWQTNEAPPTDFDSPVPVSFLSVSGAFEIRLSWSGPADTPSDQAEAWVTLAMALLREALAEWGIGGKTTSGYGRLLHSGADPAAAARPKQIVLPKAGAIVDAQLLEARTTKGGWKAIHAPSGLIGAIQNSADVPVDKNAGDPLKLIVASANSRELAFRFPTPADQERAQRGPSKGKAHGASRQGGRR